MIRILWFYSRIYQGVRYTRQQISSQFLKCVLEEGKMGKCKDLTLTRAKLS